MTKKLIARVLGLIIILFGIGVLGGLIGAWEHNLQKTAECRKVYELDNGFYLVHKESEPYVTGIAEEGVMSGRHCSKVRVRWFNEQGSEIQIEEKKDLIFTINWVYD